MWCQDKWWMSLPLSVLLEKNYDYEMSYKMHSNIQYLCEKCGTGNSLAKCRHLLTIAGCPLYFDTLNSWHSWHFQHKIPDLLDKKISHKALHTLDPGNPVFLKYVIVTISVFPKWDHLKKIWFIIKWRQSKGQHFTETLFICDTLIFEK